MSHTRHKPARLLFLLISLIISAIAYASQDNGTTALPQQPSALATPANSVAPAVVVAEAAGAACHARGVLPDPTCTPGTSDPAVTQSNMAQTICRSGYTKTVRPPVSYTDHLKTEQMQQYGFTDSLHLHEEDHLISLELGGSPSDPKNLWPEPGNSPNPKDKVENDLHAAVCSGRLTLADAQHRIATDWTTALQGL